MIELLVQNNGKVYDISEIVNKLDTRHVLNNGCGTLTFEYIPAGVEITRGDIVRFREDGDELFYGKVFKTSGRKKSTISVTVHDQLRYGKAKDTIAVNGDTAGSLVKRMCNCLGLAQGRIADTGYLLAVDVQEKTWLDMIYGGISDTLVGTGTKYRLADVYGSVTLTDLSELSLPLVLGDNSLCYDYEYSISIDDEFYNQIKLASDNESTGKRDIFIAKDSASIGSFGLLQYFEVLDKNVNEAQAKSKADALLELYNKEVQALRLSCLGDNRVREGCSIYGSIGDIHLDRRLIVKSVKHSYLPVHTMELEVCI